MLCVQNSKQLKCPSVDEWIKKLWYIYTIGYYSAIKIGGNLTFSKSMDGPGEYCAKWNSQSKEDKYHIISLLLKIFYLFIFRERRREGEREGNVWLPVMLPLLGTWPKTQAYALIGNWMATLWFTGPHSIQWATPARADFSFMCYQKYHLI